MSTGSTPDGSGTSGADEADEGATVALSSSSADGAVDADAGAEDGAGALLLGMPVDTGY